MKINLLADISISPPGGIFKGIGTGPLSNPGNGIDTFTKFISTVIGVMTIVAFIWFVFVIFIGAIGILGSGGDKNALESAKKKMTTGVIGLVVVIASIFIIRLVGVILGLPDILGLPYLFTLIQ